MSKPRPSSNPRWATDTNYPPGSDPWSDTPTKSTPSGGKRGTGFLPKTKIPAEEVNSTIDAPGEWAEYVDDRIEEQHFGDGSDGPEILAPGVHNLTRDMYYTTLVVQGSATLKTNGFWIYARYTILIESGATVDGSGKNATGVNGGTCAGPHGCPGASATANDGASAFPYTVGLGGSAGVGVGNGGNGGTGTGGNGTTITAPVSKDYLFGSHREARVPGGVQIGSTNNTLTQGQRGSSVDTIRGGGGGGAGGGDGANLGAGGGAGGSLVGMSAPSITIETGANMWSNGGNGATPAAGNTGGGGAGAGGAFEYVCRTLSDAGSYQASTGNHGFAHGGGAAGTVNADGNETPLVVTIS